jgi:hypothetical protein
MHSATPRFWRCYQELPERDREQADRAFALLRQNPRHPSLPFKQVGRFWSVRVGPAIRALAVEDGEDFIWVWVGRHDEYDRMTS